LVKRFPYYKANSPAFLILVFLCGFIQPANASNSDLLLFGGSNHKDFLGCINCPSHDTKSICNDYAEFGNKFFANMWNPFSSPYGNAFLPSSPWNEFSGSNEVPILADRQGNFLGFFTINSSRKDAVEFSSELNQIYKNRNGDLDNVRLLICQAFGILK
jgi:hypothetical protein